MIRPPICVSAPLADVANLLIRSHLEARAGTAFATVQMVLMVAPSLMPGYASRHPSFGTPRGPLRAFLPLQRLYLVVA
ncbi:unnamed protein product [Arctogadus glacialis]